MNCLRRCADACCRASFFSPLLLFITVSHCFLFLFSCSKLPTSTTPQEFTSSQCTRLVPRCVYVFHDLLVCSYKSLYVFVSLVFNTFIALCVVFSSSVRSLSLSLSRSFAIFALKKPNTFCVLFCYYYLCVSVED